ncbi:acetyltransferase, GNAT family family [Paecilomyces variotii No. 5]|uniref:Acetyltransferase, GNAT family family n=1 Tax=Byssochlamys spectabilis (strain No. 5 / NBRC 109023) TaxID=1356009 RepID=V5G616_BYSSN|nr:acetyltransferase, GNAT family family [Paecilomyces variotii No. 5]
MPIKTNPRTGELYVSLRAPHSNIIITPPRRAGPDSTDPDPADCAKAVSLLNDPRVYPFLTSPPYPYLLSHAEEHLRKILAASEQFLPVARKASEGGSGTYVGGCPFSSIREIVRRGDVDGDGNYDAGWERDILIGDVGIMRYPFYELPEGSEERREAQERNAKLEPGDGKIIWTIGDYLAPSHHGRGIMTAVVRALINEWAIPHMNAHIIKVSTYVGNTGSVRVFEKNGFEMEHILENWSTIPENRGGGKVSINVLAWRAST